MPRWPATRWTSLKSARSNARISEVEAELAEGGAGERAVMGLKATLPMTFNQILSSQLGLDRRLQPAAGEGVGRVGSSLIDPSGSPRMKRVPSTWRTTPGWMISVTQ